MSDTLNKLSMLLMANRGNTEAHLFIERVGRASYKTTEQIKYSAKNKNCRFFAPPKPEDLIIMFSDKSGAYVHADGFITVLGVDISKEIINWTEIV